MTFDLKEIKKHFYWYEFYRNFKDPSWARKPISTISAISKNFYYLKLAHMEIDATALHMEYSWAKKKLHTALVYGAKGPEFMPRYVHFWFEQLSSYNTFASYKETFYHDVFFSIF